ncbi:MAG: hypothetical protein FJ267_00535 [Planctomycetes bacterium]|nr:hypothetical protein [Planctomycetota bacterium]
MGDNLLILMNAHHELIPFTMPQAVQQIGTVDCLFDTSTDETTVQVYDTSEPYPLKSRSMVLLRHKAVTGSEERVASNEMKVTWEETTNFKLWAEKDLVDDRS